MISEYGPVERKNEKWVLHDVDDDDDEDGSARKMGLGNEVRVASVRKHRRQRRIARFFSVHDTKTRKNIPIM
jgi:hypothetical protein